MLRLHTLSRALLALALGAASLRGQSGETRAGLQAFDAQRYAEARTHLAAAARADARDATAALYLGRLELMDGDADAAVQWLEKAAALDPKSGETQRFLGAAYGRQATRASKFKALGIARKTRAALETAVRLEPNSVDARAALLQYYAVAPGIAGGSRDKAREQAAAIARLNPLRGLLAEGAVAEAAGDLATAEARYRAAERDHADSAAPYLLLGAMQQRRKQYAEAVRTYDRLLARRDEPAAHYQAGRALALAGTDLPRAERELTRYLGLRLKETEPSPSSAHYYLGLTYERKGDSSSARREYQETLRLDPGRAEARAALKRVP